MRVITGIFSSATVLLAACPQSPIHPPESAAWRDTELASDDKGPDKGDIDVYDIDCSDLVLSGDLEKHCAQASCMNDESKAEVTRRYENLASQIFVALFMKNVWLEWTELKLEMPKECKDVKGAEQFLTTIDKSTTVTPDNYGAPPPSNPVWDQEGNPVRFEVRVNPSSSRYIEQKSLRSRIGQAFQSSCKTSINKKWRYEKADKYISSGPVHIKFAWRPIVSDDECDQYGFITASGAKCAKGEEGLVALHVATKVNSAGDKWLWATFSHKNNTLVLPGAPPPLFRDPECRNCKENACPECKAGICKTQISRSFPHARRSTIPLPHEVNFPNSSYELIGVQRVPDPYTLEGCAHTDPMPELLSNEILEWDRQESSCLGCHSRARINVLNPLKNETCRELYVCSGPANPCVIKVDPSGDWLQHPNGKDRIFRTPSYLADMFWFLDSVQQ